MALSATIATVIELATKSQIAKMDRNKEGSDRIPICEPFTFDDQLPEETALIEFFNGLNAAEIYMMIAIMYLGRGDFGTRDRMLKEYSKMSDSSKPAEWAASQMLEKSSQLVTYLQQGLKILENENIDRIFQRK